MLLKNWGCWFILKLFVHYAQVLDGLLFAWESLDKVFVCSGCTHSSSNALAIYATRPPCVHSVVGALCFFNSAMNSGICGMSNCSAVKPFCSKCSWSQAIATGTLGHLIALDLLIPSSDQLISHTTWCKLGIRMALDKPFSKAEKHCYSPTQRSTD